MVTVSGKRLIIRKKNLHVEFSTDDTVVVKGNRVKVRSCAYGKILFEVSFDLRKLNRYTIDHPALERFSPAPTEIVKVRRKSFVASRISRDSFISIVVPHPIYRSDNGQPMKKVVTYTIRDT